MVYRAGLHARKGYPRGRVALSNTEGTVTLAEGLCFCLHKPCKPSGRVIPESGSRYYRNARPSKNAFTR